MSLEIIFRFQKYSNCDPIATDFKELKNNLKGYVPAWNNISLRYLKQFYLIPFLQMKGINVDYDDIVKVEYGVKILDELEGTGVFVAGVDLTGLGSTRCEMIFDKRLLFSGIMGVFDF